MMQKRSKKVSLLAPKVPLSKAMFVSHFLTYTSRGGTCITYTCMHTYTYIYTFIVYMNKCY